MCVPPPFLTLSPESCREFLNRAIAKFGQGSYIADLCREIRDDQGISISRDTIPRILNGRRGRSHNVTAICRYFDVIWQEACITSDLLPSDDIESLVKRIRNKVEFRFEYSNRASSQQQQKQWIQNNFIEPDLVEVEFLPSEYPVGDPRTLLENGESKEKEDDFDRLGVRLLRGTNTTSRKVLDDHKNIFVYGEPVSGKSSYLLWVD